MNNPVVPPGAAEAAALGAFLDDALGGHEPVAVERLAGGGSCEVFALERAGAHWVLRRAPRHANVRGAHDVIREFRLLDAIKDEGVRIPRPVVSCPDPAVFGAPFYVMDRIYGVPIRGAIPEAWAAEPSTQGRALEEMIDALVRIHAVDWRRCGLGDLEHPPGYLERQIARWIAQLDAYDGRELPAARDLAGWLREHLPHEPPQRLCHGDYKLDNLLFAETAPPHLLAVVDWEMAAVGAPLVDLAWALFFHPAEGSLGRTGQFRFDPAVLPSAEALAERYAERSGTPIDDLGWYQVFSRWKLGIVLEGSYAKFLRGRSDNPVHEAFGAMVDTALAQAVELVTKG